MLNSMEANGFVSTGEKLLVVVDLVQVLKAADTGSQLMLPLGYPFMITILMFDLFISMT